jgi:hypothetical protein
MSEVRKDQDPKKPLRNPEFAINTGILKDKEKREIETELIDTLKTMSRKLTKKDIDSLLSRVEVGKGLEGLRQALQKEKKLDSVEFSDETLQTILDLIRESKSIEQELTKNNIEELRLEISKLNPSAEYEIDKQIYLTNRFPWIKRFENSELGKNIIIDIAGIAVGALDSAQAIFKFLLRLLVDLVKLPVDVVKELSHKKK